MAKGPVALLPFDPDLCLSKVCMVRRWRHAELGLVQEATMEEVHRYYQGKGLPLYSVLPPNGDRTVLVRKVY